MEVLLRMINREPAESQLELLRPELVIRESTATPVLGGASRIDEKSS